MSSLGVAWIVRSTFVDGYHVVGYVCFGVWFACPWFVVGDRVVDGLAAYVAGSAPSAYVLAHSVLHGTVAFDHALTYL